MTALTSPAILFPATTAVSPLQRARSGTLDYYTEPAAGRPVTELRDMTALETMYAYFGSDVAGG
jgi:hypothetical protein